MVLDTPFFENKYSGMRTSRIGCSFDIFSVDESKQTDSRHPQAAMDGRPRAMTDEGHVVRHTAAEDPIGLPEDWELEGGLCRRNFGSDSP